MIVALLVCALLLIFEVFHRLFLLFEGSVRGQVSYLILLRQVFAKCLNESWFP